MAKFEASSLETIAEQLQQIQKQRQQQLLQEKQRQQQLAKQRQKQEQDHLLFSQEMVGVTPLNDTNKLVLKTTVSKKKIKLFADIKAVSTLSDQLDISHNMKQLDGLAYYLQQSNNVQLIKRLRQGVWPIQAGLDLHGLTIDQARERFAGWVANCYKGNLRSLCLVHGKGWGTVRQPILKTVAYSWALQMPQIIAFSQAPENFGGTGAMLILLKKEIQ